MDHPLDTQKVSHCGAGGARVEFIGGSSCDCFSSFWVSGSVGTCIILPCERSGFLGDHVYLVRYLGSATIN